MKLVLLVADIGGPPALHDLLSQLPRQFGLPIIVLQSFDVGLLETSAAVLRRTVQLRVSLIEGRTTLEAGHVYFARPEVAYRLHRTPQQLLLEPVAGASEVGVLVQTMASVAEVCKGRVTAIFLSGRGRGEELTAGCRALIEGGCDIIVLDRLEAVVSDMAKQVLDCAAAAREMGVTEIVNYLAVTTPIPEIPPRRSGKMN